MEINAQDRPFAIPRYPHGRIVEGQRPSHETAAELQDKNGRANPIMNPERFVSADEAAQFLGIKRRHLLVLARKGIPGAYPLGTGMQRKLWVFRLSELAGAIVGEAPTLIQKSAKSATIHSGSPR